MAELSSVLLLGAGLVTAGAVATWPALRRRVRRRKRPTPQPATRQVPARPTSATPFALLEVP
jgi:hypothetical protein